MRLRKLLCWLSAASFTGAALAQGLSSAEIPDPTPEQKAQVGLDGAIEIVSRHRELFHAAAALHACGEDAKADLILDQKVLLSEAQEYVTEHRGNLNHGEGTVTSLMVGLAGFEIGSEETAKEALASLNAEEAASACREWNNKADELFAARKDGPDNSGVAKEP